jgi:hypothetical protein
VEQHAVWLSAHLPYADVQQVLARIGQIGLSASTAWGRVQTHGAQAQAFEAVQQAAATALPTRREPQAGQARLGARQGVTLDGGMVPIRQEGWKELKLGCHFNVDVRLEQDPHTHEWAEYGYARDTAYVGYLGGPEAFGQALYTLAYQRGWLQAADTLVLGDGAAWIWNQAKEHFYDSTSAVDWYHADEHLADASKLLHEDGTARAQTWHTEHRTTLFTGQAVTIAEALSTAAHTAREATPPNVAHADALETAAGYVHEHQRRMQYQELRENLWPIGSGTVESAAKQFKARFAGPGMQWSRAGFNALLPFRAALMSGSFDAYWQKVHCPRN